jgi:hypothetical protein
VPKNSSKKWTPEDDKRLLELAATGKLQVIMAQNWDEAAQRSLDRLGILKTRAKNPSSLNPDEGS